MELNEKAMSEIDNRNDGTVEVIEVKLNNRKTKKKNWCGKNKKPKNKEKINLVNESIDSGVKNLIHKNKNVQSQIKTKLSSRFKCPIEEKVIFRKHP